LVHSSSELIAMRRQSYVGADNSKAGLALAEELRVIRLQLYERRLELRIDAGISA
jgi:hypothetical protein